MMNSSVISILGADFMSNSGPNNFARRLSWFFHYRGYQISLYPNVGEKTLVIIEYPDYLISDYSQVFQRLDGLWYNSKIDWKKKNSIIKKIYRKSKGIIFQSKFSRDLVFNFFGEKDKYAIIHNGFRRPENVDFNTRTKAQTIVTKLGLEKYDYRFFAAASWRPHKRLKEIIEVVRSLRKHINCCVIVAGEYENNLDFANDDFVKFVGNVNEMSMYVLYYLCNVTFCITWLDNCPNAAVESIVSGTPVICTNSGGTKEIIKGRGLVVDADPEWDFKPHDHLSPPRIDTDMMAEKILESRVYEKYINSADDLDLLTVANKYIDFMWSV